ncbi:MAG TPA: hypothetical protein DIC46_09765, partial [Porphyromonadaceae bacterium]|nr:hypothetical protein [Porphyromonadaceae bacterium]
MRIIICFLFLLCAVNPSTGCGSPREKKVSGTVHQQPAVVADSILDRILELYAVPQHGLLTET